MAATVTGTFLLIDRASGPLRRIERQAQQTDSAIADLGSRLDNIGTQNQMAQHEKLGQSLRDIDTNAEIATGGMESLGEAIDETGDVANRATGRMGRFGRMMLLVGGAIAALFPIVIDLAGALGALVGSLGAAIKGVGALGVALGGAIVVGLAGVAGAALAAKDRMENLKGEVKELGETWQGLTGRGQNDFMAMIRDSMADIERLMPMLAKSVNRTMPAARDAVDQFFQRLSSPTFERFVERMTTSFERIAGPIAQTLASVGETLGNIAVATAPFVEEMVRGIADITRGWAGSTRNIENLRENLRGAVSQAKEWWDLLHAIWDLTKAVFGSGADEGQSLVRDMTNRLREYEKWITSNPEKMDKFWKDSILGTKELAKFLGSLRLPLKNLNDAMEPLVRFFERLTGALARLEIPFTNISGLTAVLTAIGGVKAFRGLQGLMGGNRGATPANPVFVRDMGARSPGRGGPAIATGPPGRGGDPDGKGRAGGRFGRLGAFAGKLGKVLPILGLGLVANEMFSKGNIFEKIVSAGNIIDPTTLVAMFVDPENPDGLFKRLAEELGGGEGLPDLAGTSGYERQVRRRHRRQMNRARRGIFDGPDVSSIPRSQQEPGRIYMNPGFDPTDPKSVGRAIGEEVKVPKLDDREFKKTADAIEAKATRLNRRVKDDTSDKWHKTRRAMVTQMKEAYPELERAMRKIRDMTVGELAGMGYSRSEARDMMNFSNGGGGQGKGDGLPAGGRNRRPKDNAMGGRLEGFAAGGRIRGQGKKDTVPVTMGMAAPGELIVNRHTEGRVNSMLGMFGTNLGREVGNETVPHSGTPQQGHHKHGHGPGVPHVYHAKGGRVAYPDAMGALPGLDALAYFLKQKFGLSVTSGLRPGAITSSGNPSDHGWGGAIDVSNGVTTPQMDAAHAWLQANFSGAIKQMLYRTMVGGNHFDHIHVALNESYARNAGAVARLAGGKGVPIVVGDGGPMPQINLKAPRSGLRGAPGMMSQGGMNAMTEGMEKAVNRRLRGGRGVGPAAGGRAVGASIYGGPRDSVSGTVGYRGDSLPGTMSYAELGMGTLLGGLPRLHPLRISYGGKSVVARKRDIGAGGGDVQGLPRAIDLWHETANALGFPFGVGVVRVQNAGKNMAHGGRIPQFGGWYGNGGKFTADRPTLIGVGERGKETVEVTPASRGSAGKRGGGVSISNITINNHREGDIRKQIKRELSQAFDELEREIGNDTGNGIV